MEEGLWFLTIFESARFVDFADEVDRGAVALDKPFFSAENTEFRTSSMAHSNSLQVVGIGFQSPIVASSPGNPLWALA